jgi:hypothetical protein
VTDRLRRFLVRRHKIAVVVHGSFRTDAYTGSMVCTRSRHQACGDFVCLG